MLTVLSSAFPLHLHTVVMNWGQEAVPALTSNFCLFVRFLLGWIIISCVFCEFEGFPRWKVALSPQHVSRLRQPLAPSYLQGKCFHWVTG